MRETGARRPAPPRAAARRPTGKPSVARLVRAGLPQDVLGRLELERRVVDVEVGREARSKVVEDVARPPIRAENDVGGHDIHPAGDRPRVEIVDVDHARRLADMALDLAELDAFG